ncbi:hypothetical protein SAMN05216308_1283 [Nitrosospira sp. Nsp13]|nr:hypothetical protein SAMN05216308_1283 [Nitrosospira sp. Nsp13]
MQLADQMGFEYLIRNMNVIQPYRGGAHIAAKTATWNWRCCQTTVIAADLAVQFCLNFFNFKVSFQVIRKVFLTKLWFTLRRQPIQHQRIWTFTNGTDALASDIARKF